MAYSNILSKPYFLLTFILVIGFNLVGQGQTAQQVQLNTISTAVPFLMIAPDSRSSGMGDAGLGFSPDANSLHWNPANIAFGEDKFQASFSYSPWMRDLLPGMNFMYLSMYGKLNKKQAIGGSIRYLSIGDVESNNGYSNGNELAFDVTFAQQIGEHFSGGLSARYIYSNLNQVNIVVGDDIKPAQSFAVDLSIAYLNSKVKLGSKDMDIRAGINISNIGAKMSYTNSSELDFLPTNLRLGSGFTLHFNAKNELTWAIDFNKLLVPTPPIYATDENGLPIKDNEGNYMIELGKDPNIFPAEGMIHSFYDAPGIPIYNDQNEFVGIEKGSVFKEEMNEINISTGLEYYYASLFALRVGYFYEAPTKGNRQYVTLGAGVHYANFTFDFSYLIATTQRNALANTLHFTLKYTIDDLQGKSNMFVPSNLN